MSFYTFYSYYSDHSDISSHQTGNHKEHSCHLAIIMARAYQVYRVNISDAVRKLFIYI